MSFLGAGSWTSDPRESTAAEPRFVRRRRAQRSDRLAEATLACARCDAPVAIGPGRRAVSAELSCPFCGHTALVRDFLSLGRPTRPTRVVVRIGLPPAVDDVPTGRPGVSTAAEPRLGQRASGAGRSNPVYTARVASAI